MTRDPGNVAAMSATEYSGKPVAAGQMRADGETWVSLL
jgi:hypothetical protein